MTKEEIFPKIAYAEQPFGNEPPSIHCPFCGQMSIGENRPDEERCEHTVFIHTDLIGEYEYTSDEFASRLEAFEEQIDEENDEEILLMEYIDELLPKLGYGKELLVFQVTYGGMCATPMWDTVTFGYTLGKATNKE